jgi:hypothetical protein
MKFVNPRPFADPTSPRASEFSPALLAPALPADPRGAAAERLRLTAAKSRASSAESNSPLLLPQMTAGFAHHTIDPALDARQCGIVRGRTGIFNDSIDQLARSLRFAVDFGVLRIVILLKALVPQLIGRLLQFCDHHTAKRESPFER